MYLVVPNTTHQLATNHDMYLVVPSNSTNDHEVYLVVPNTRHQLATNHEVYLVVPSTTHLLAATYDEPTYVNAVTSSGPLIDTSNDTCLTPATTEPPAAAGENADKAVDDDDNTESPATSSTVRPTASSTAYAHQAFNM